MNTKEELQNNRAKWLAALRSGDYSQAKQKLHCSDGFCCLGVLADVYQQETGVRLPVNSAGYLEGNKLDSQESFVEGVVKINTSLVQVAKWVGLRSAVGTFTNVNDLPLLGGRTFGSLVFFNDIAGSNFEQIADIIESEAKQLFID